MSDLYWITVLGNLNYLGVLSMVISALLLLVCIIILVCAATDSEEKAFKIILKYIKCLIVSFVTGILLTTFIPEKKDLYLIYGVGSTLDYIKNNREAQRLPDNVIKAINIYLEDNIIDGNRNKKSN